MLRSFRLVVVSLILLSARFLVALAAPVIARVAEVWPRAFPATTPPLRTQGERLSREDAKPLARRVRAYHQRVAQRHDHDRRAIPGLILAV